MSIKVFTVYEDRQTKLNVSAEEMAELLSFKSLFGQENFVLQADGTILIRHYIGYVSGRYSALQVLPKVYQEETQINREDEKDEAVRLFFRLLKWSEFDSVKELPDTQAVSSLKGDLLEIFISLFTTKFLQLFIRNTHRQYVEFDDEMQFIKGKIDFSQTILRCNYKKHMHHVRFDDLTMDNLLNAIFKTVMIHLVERTASEENRKKLLIALSYMEEISSIRLSKLVFNSVRFNRLNEEYRPLFNMVRMFFYNMQPGYRQGDEEVFSFFVPLNRLFEFYVYRLLDESMKEYKSQGYRIQYQGPQEYLVRCGKENAFKLKPDITILSDSVVGGNVQSILDVKYKNPSAISPSDIYQMTSYAVHYGCKSMMLIYPSFKNNRELVNKPKEYIITTFTGEVSLFIVQIDIFEEDINKTKIDINEKILSGRVIKQVVNY